MTAGVNLGSCSRTGLNVFTVPNNIVDAEAATELKLAVSSLSAFPTSICAHAYLHRGGLPDMHPPQVPTALL